MQKQAAEFPPASEVTRAVSEVWPSAAGVDVQLGGHDRIGPRHLPEGAGGLFFLVHPLELLVGLFNIACTIRHVGTRGPLRGFFSRDATAQSLFQLRDSGDVITADLVEGLCRCDMASLGDLRRRTGGVRHRTRVFEMTLDPFVGELGVCRVPLAGGFRCGRLSWGGGRTEAGDDLGWGGLSLFLGRGQREQAVLHTILEGVLSETA